VCCVLCAVCCVLCAVCCVLRAVFCLLCAVCCALCAVCSVLSALCSVCCVLCSVCCVLCAVCCMLFAVSCVLCAVCFVLCAECMGEMGEIERWEIICSADYSASCCCCCCCCCYFCCCCCCCCCYCCCFLARTNLVLTSSSQLPPNFLSSTLHLHLFPHPSHLLPFSLLPSFRPTAYCILHAPYCVLHTVQAADAKEKLTLKMKTEADKPCLVQEQALLSCMQGETGKKDPLACRGVVDAYATCALSSD
jgi:hypothetical protein